MRVIRLLIIKNFITLRNQDLLAIGNLLPRLISSLHNYFMHGKITMIQTLIILPKYSIKQNLSV